MDKLSFEIVDLIVSQLDAADAVALSQTCRATRAPSLARLDPARYLGRTFRYGRSLLAAMADHGCILSGSRALGFFFPGSCDEESSDWDFLVPCVPHCMRGMMHALEQCGVTWHNPLAGLMALPFRPVGSKVQIPMQRLYRKTPRVLREEFAALGEPLTEEFLHLYNFVHTQVHRTTWDMLSKIEITLVDAEKPGRPASYRLSQIRQSQGRSYIGGEGHNGEDGEGADDNDESDYMRPYGHIMSTFPIYLINGHISVNGQSQKVQLFQSHRLDTVPCTPMEFITTWYYGTHVQCFLSGFCAGHLYFDLARQRQAVLWRLLTRVQYHTVLTCMAKYRERGYSFYSVKDIDNRLDDCLMTDRSFSDTTRYVCQHSDDRLAPEDDENENENENEIEDEEGSAEAAQLRHRAVSDQFFQIGQPGSLLLRYVRHNEHLVACARRVASRVEGEQASTVRRHIAALTQAAARIRIANTLGHSKAVEPSVPLKWCGHEVSKRRMGSLSKLVSQGSLDDNMMAGISKTPLGVVSSSDAIRYGIYISMSPFTCMEDCSGYLAYGPPQI